eukprot:COSAG02_NODE_248_length_27133_cov_45.131723_22_plen_173_part_00
MWQRRQQQQHRRQSGSRWVSTAAALLAVMEVCAAGPPYLYVDGESVLFKPALFGPAVIVSGCSSVKASPRYAETAALHNAAEIAGKVAVIDRDPPDKTGSSRLSFVEKAQRAEAAGAVMAVMVNTKEENLRCVDLPHAACGPARNQGLACRPNAKHLHCVTAPQTRAALVKP